MLNETTVSRVLQTKGQGFVAVGPDATAYDALEIMAEKNIGALLVLSEGRLAGIFSERDYARKVILKGKSSRETPVRDIMSSPVVSVGRDTSLRDCMVLMTQKHIRHLPVVEHGNVTGVVSIGDVVNAIISAQAATIEELEEYIAGTGYQ